jgi:glycosyltransferase involved in cell wall biosynthesis
MPLVSVGVPVYNGEACLRNAVEALLRQTHAELEVIISDNASTDRTEAIGRALQQGDARVRYLRQPRNLGAPANWNVVARAARGRYFKWMSASDSCNEGFLQRAVDCLERDADVVLCFARTQYIDDAGNVISLAQTDFAVSEASPSARFWRVCSELQINNAQSGLIRRDALLQTRLDRLYPHGDRVLMAELAMRGKFVLLDEPLLQRRATPAHWTALRSEEELARMFWPDGAPRRPLVHLRRLADYFGSALRAPVSLGERLRAAGHALRYAWWRQRDIAADMATLLRPAPRRAD